MKQKVYLLGLLFLLFKTVGGQADQIAWVQLDSRFSYQDPDLSCSDKTSPLKTLFLMVRLDNSEKVIKAELRDDGSWPLARIAFLPSEVLRIKMEKDVVGDYWIKELPLSTRLLTWMFFNLSSDPSPSMGCRPSQEFSKLSPEVSTFVFQQKSAVEYFSPSLAFQGVLRDGKAFFATLGLSQTLYLPPSP